MSYRMPNYGNSYMDSNARLGYSSVSKNYAYSNKSNLFFYIRLWKCRRSEFRRNLVHARKLEEKV